MATKRVYEIDGMQFQSLDGFFEVISTCLIPDAPCVRGLDGFNDILRGGFGTPPGGFVIRWKNSHVSQERLGFPETIRQLRIQLDSCHPANRDYVAQELLLAEAHQGQTVFDLLVRIIRDHCPGGDEQEDEVELELC